jgi:hypothetical protein
LSQISQYERLLEVEPVQLAAVAVATPFEMVGVAGSLTTVPPELVAEVVNGTVKIFEYCQPTLRNAT